MHETCARDTLQFVEPARFPTALNPRLGIVGGGQLPKTTGLAELQLGSDVGVLERNNDSPAATDPLVETVQREHICHLVCAPAPVAGEIAERTWEIAGRAVSAVGAVGSFEVEMFLTASGEIFINELAPRVHNSGHFTIEACRCSQFENHVRAVLGWPLGDTRMVAPAAVMVNLLGDRKAVGRPVGLERALAIPGAHVHIYGKAMSGAGRKMGHVTALGATLDEALATAQRAASQIRFGAES